MHALSDPGYCVYMSVCVCVGFFYIELEWAKKCKKCNRGDAGDRSRILYRNSRTRTYDMCMFLLELPILFY